MAAGGPPSARLSWLRSKNWDEHIEDVERVAGSPGFLMLRDRVLKLARLDRRDQLLDVGAGTGLLAVAAASRVASVSALDVSPAMCRYLERRCKRLGIENVEILLSTATHIPLAESAVDVVVSNYCFHHLDDGHKRRALAEIRRVLRPGGRLVFADMMFRVSMANRRDRAVIAMLVKRILRRGPAGVLRLLKNATRIAAGSWEQPAGVEWWNDALLQSGFVGVTVEALEHEGGIAFARKPE